MQKNKNKNQYKAWIYLSPALFLVLIWLIYPLINTFLISFYEEYTYIDNAYSSIGFNNYVRILTHRQFWIAMKNTFLIVFVTVPLSMIIALLIAVGLNSIKPLKGIYQTIFFLPYVTNVIAIGMVFTVMFDQSYGIINQLLGYIGIDPVNWINAGASFSSSFAVLSIYSIWAGLPFKILIFLSALQSVDRQYYQAAKIDGTSKKRTFFKITVPMISPMIAYLAVTSFIGAFKAYQEVIAIFGDNLGSAGNLFMLDTVVAYIYRSLTSTAIGAVGEASAAAVILLIIIMAITAVNLFISKKKVYY